MSTFPRGRWLKAFSSILGVSLAFGLGEGLLRITSPERLARIEYPCFYEPDAQLGFHYRQNSSGRVAGHFEIENLAVTNSLGFYDDEPLAAGAATPRILAVGDSFTAAMNVPRSAVWTAVLERRLRAEGWPQADVVNLGLDGTGSDVHAALIERELPRFSPDVVVLAFFGNDFTDVLNGRFERECYRNWVLSYQDERQRGELRARVDAHLSQSLHRYLFDHLFLVRLLTLAVEGPRSLHHIQFVQPSAAELGIDDAARQRRMPDLTRALGDLERIARSCACRFVVAPVPAKVGLDGSLRVFQERVRAGVFEIFDVAPVMQRRLDARGLALQDLFFEHDAHLDALGNELFGEAVFELLAPALPRPRAAARLE